MPDHSKAKKVDISFTNWVLGGSLVSVNDGHGRRRTSSRKVSVLEVTEGKPIKAATSEKKAEHDTTSKDSSGGDEKQDKDKDKKGDEKRGKKDAVKRGEGGTKVCCKECGQCSSDDTDHEKDDDQKKDAKSDESKKDEPNPEASKKSADADAEVKDWTEGEDAMIMAMKASNTSWNTIGLAIGASKKEVQARFKELTNADDKKKTEDAAKESGGGASEKVDAAGLDFENLFLDDDWGANSKTHGEKDGKKDNAGSKDNSKKKGDGKSNKSRNSNKSTRSEVMGGGNGGNGGNDGGGWNNGGPIGGSRIDGGLPELRPNSIWSESDVDLLMFLEDRYNQEKWLQLQAGFFNWTGRMVDSEIIKAKFQEDGLI